MATPLFVLAGKADPQGDVGHDTAQLTPMFVGSLLRVALNFAVVPTVTVAEFGCTVTVPPGTVTVAVDEAEISATAVAVIVTAKSAGGGSVGAV